jgi:hypothetical protein
MIASTAPPRTWLWSFNERTHDSSEPALEPLPSDDDVATLLKYLGRDRKWSR